MSSSLRSISLQTRVFGLDRARNEERASWPKYFAEVFTPPPYSRSFSRRHLTALALLSKLSAYLLGSPLSLSAQRPHLSSVQSLPSRCRIPGEDYLVSPPAINLLQRE